MSAKKKAIKELLRAKKLYINPVIDKVRTVGLRGYTSRKAPTSAVMHDAGLLDAVGFNRAKDFLKKKLAQTDASLKGLAHISSGDSSSAAKLKDSLKALRKAKSSDLASKYKYKNIDLKNKLMAKSLFIVPSVVAADRMFTDGHGTAKDED
jgi:hypothetical protein